MVEISDIIEAINDNQRLYDWSKKRIINSLKRLDVSKIQEERMAKIIEFPVKH